MSHWSIFMVLWQVINTNLFVLISFFQIQSLNLNGYTRLLEKVYHLQKNISLAQQAPFYANLRSFLMHIIILYCFSVYWKSQWWFAVFNSTVSSVDCCSMHLFWTVSHLRDHLHGPKKCLTCVTMSHLRDRVSLACVVLAWQGLYIFQP